MTSIEQNILPASNSFPSTINICHVSQRHAGHACRHLMANPTSRTVLPIGIAYHISSIGKVDFIALSSVSTVFVISFDGLRREKAPLDRDFAILLSAGGLEALDDTQPKVCLVGFGMPRTAVLVNQATQLRVRGVDLSMLFAANSHEPWSPAQIIKERVSSFADKWQIASLWMGDDRSVERDICLQAWLATCVGTRCVPVLDASVKVDTKFVNASELACLAKMITQSDLLESHKPKEASNDFSKAGFNKYGKFELLNSRYKTRVRRSDQTRVILTDENGNEYVGNAHRAKGKTITIRMHDNQRPIGTVNRVKVIGRQEPTNPEKAQAELIFLIMTRQKDLRQSPFIRILWFPHYKNSHRALADIDGAAADAMASRMKLNESQCRVVQSMVGDMPVVVTHGPPGTGKTTTISAASRIWDLYRCPVWIVAHSNVAVKNIAETLFKKEVDFKLIVSKEFYDEWHEHIYAEVLEKVIRSDELPTEVGDMERMIGDSHIVLCTLSMISNPALHDNGTFDIVAVERLVIDEASQINVFEFLHVFEKFQFTLEKVCFFGDPKQLPPYGQDKVPSIETIFDLKHISSTNDDFFLDTQYRMPRPIGNFISDAVYERRLRSWTEHPIVDPKCIAFIDVNSPRGNEEKVGFSWKNTGEIGTIVHLVQHYYKLQNFCVITPYDAQRAAIQKALEIEMLPWDSVYNLDSFQGNEADYVLVSIVRSSQPGFLVSLNRMNVLLTRCRKGLIIVTSREFLELGGSSTLLGKLSRYWQVQHKGSHSWIDWRYVANATADLPGVLGNRACPTNIVSVSRQTPYTVPNFPAYSGFASMPAASWQRRPLDNRNAWADPERVDGLLDGFRYLQDENIFPSLPKMPILPGSWRGITLPPHQHSLLSRNLPGRRPPVRMNTTANANDSSEHYRPKNMHQSSRRPENDLVQKSGNAMTQPNQPLQKGPSPGHNNAVHIHSLLQKSHPHKQQNSNSKKPPSRTAQTKTLAAAVADDSTSLNVNHRRGTVRKSFIRSIVVHAPTMR